MAKFINAVSPADHIFGYKPQTKKLSMWCGVTFINYTFNVNPAWAQQQYYIGANIRTKISEHASTP